MPFAPLLAALLATCAPALLAYSVSPSATFLNQAAAVVGWGVFLSVVLTRLPLAPSPQKAARRTSGRLALGLALLLLALAAAGSGVFCGLPLPLALSSALMLLAALGAALAGMAAASAGQRLAVFQALACATVAAGLLAVAVGGVQVFAPDWADGQWIAISALEGRATGNIRQPNHLGSLLAWAVIAAVALWEIKRWRGPGSSAPSFSPWAQAFLQWLLVAVLVLGIVLSASRTAVVGLLVLAAWGLLDRRLSRPGRALLLATPVLYAVIWSGLTAWADATGHAFGGAARFSVQGDVSSSRFGVWANTLALIAQHPWTGVGWGGFNFAWSLTPFPNRPVAFFDHTHNLVLQLAVELGVPLAALVLGLLSWALWRAGVAAWRAAPGPQAVVLRSSWVMLLLMALHSQLEYPLWYAYFLLPTAFVWGLCLGGGAGEEREALPSGTAAVFIGTADATAPRWLPALRVGALLMAMIGVASVVDYWRVVVIFVPPVGAAPLAERIRDGERSLLFAHHAYYAAATTSTAPEREAMPAFEVTTHHLLDTRLMIAWARALNAQGDVERARHLAARLREFRNPNSDTFFAPCAQQPAPEPLPFQCTAPARVMDWRDFIAR
jgi:O-antigen ligase